jgi:predicted AAA+ superfamily ATPase
LAKKFAAEYYHNCVYLDLASNKVLSTFISICETTPPLWGKQLFNKVFTSFNSNFKDVPETLVIIDEIQRSPYVYNMIREMLETCNFHLLISGSYLGMISGKRKFFTPIGNLDIITVMPVSFQEYLKAIGEHDRYMKLDLFGKSAKTDYEAIHRAYEIYIKVGGYPEILSSYLDGVVGSVELMHDSIHENVIDECKKYIEKDMDYEIFKDICRKVPKTLLDEKRGMPLDFRSIYSDGRKDIDYGNVKTALLNLKNCGLLNYCYWAKECNLNKLSDIPIRLYYNDVGMASSLLLGENTDQVAGVVAENFVYLSLNSIDKIHRGVLHKYHVLGTFEIENNPSACLLQILQLDRSIWMLPIQAMRKIHCQQNVFMGKLISFKEAMP